MTTITLIVVDIYFGWKDIKFLLNPRNFRLFDDIPLEDLDSLLSTPIIAVTNDSLAIHSIAGDSATLVTWYEPADEMDA